MKRNDLALVAGKLTNFSDPLKIHKQKYNYKEQIMNYSPQPNHSKSSNIGNGTPTRSYITDYSDMSNRMHNV